MRVAILSDTHGNLPAAEAVLEDIAKQAPDYIVAAGDLALRGAHPRETVELLESRCDAVLMGNTDCYLSGNYLGGAYREPAHWKRNLLEWTRDQLGPALCARLGQLPFSVRYSPRRGQDLVRLPREPPEPGGLAGSHARRGHPAPLPGEPGRRGGGLRASALPLSAARGPDADRRRGQRRDPPRRGSAAGLGALHLDPQGLAGADPARAATRCARRPRR